MQIDKGGFVDAGALFAHPDTPPAAISHVTYSLTFDSSGCWRISYEIGCPSDNLLLPASVTPVRTDGLWQTTCAELFLQDTQGGRYCEYNFAPSGAWAAYAFSGYREGMAALDTSPPDIVSAESKAPAPSFTLTASLASDAPQGCGPWRLGLSMVIEEACGTKSYWALRHPPGKPDFHHKHCFAINLPSPERA